VSTGDIFGHTHIARPVLDKDDDNSSECEVANPRDRKFRGKFIIFKDMDVNVSSYIITF
jgi:hypothetical protein